MYIKDIFKQKKPVISFEVFPPKLESSVETMYRTIDELAPLKPDYVSVTYGAGGSTVNNKTVELASYIKNTCNIEALAHLTCITSTKERVDGILDELIKHDIKNILALRGDIPENKDFEFPNNLSYEHSIDLVDHINKKGDFCIGGTCYPEGHNDTNNVDRDIIYLKEKINLKTDFLISQLFFNNQYFYNFLEKARKNNIKIPIEAGIMPVINKKQINRIASLCGANIPDKFKKIMNKYEDKPEALKDAGIAYATEQIIDLLSSGVDGIHVYTMNNPYVAKKITENISSVVNALNNKESKNH